MEEEKSFGKYVIITVIVAVLVIIGIIIAIIALPNDSNPLEDQTREQMKNDKEKSKNAQEKIRSMDTFKKVISELKYINEKDIYKNDLIEVFLDNDNSDFYNSNTGEKIITGTSDAFAWFGTFGIFNYDEEDHIIDENGNVLFITDDYIDFYPYSKLWQYNDSVYNSDGVVEKRGTIIDEEGKYIVSEKKGELVLEDNNLKPIYTLKLNEDDSLIDGSLDSIFDDQYALLSTDEYDIIVNVKNGKEVFKDKAGSVIDLYNNIFEINGDTCFIKDDKIAIKEPGKSKNTEASMRYIAINNNVYDVNTLAKVDTNTYIPTIEEAKIEKLTGIELNKCRSGYGLTYKGEELLECKYDTIDFFNYNITKALMSSNKLYVMISSDDFSYDLYDVYNKKIALYNVADYVYYSPFITIYQDDNIYIYNIIDGSKTPNANGDEVELYPNYYVLTDGKMDIYYNSSFKEITKSKSVVND